MKKTVEQHIHELEGRVEDIRRRMMDDEVTRAGHRRLETELRVAQQALDLYREALALEHKLQAKRSTAGG